MLDAQTNQKKSIPQGNPVGKLTQFPFFGNRLVQTQVPQMSVQQLQELLAQNPSNLLLIDVRFQSEQNIACLPGDWFLVPYPQIQAGSGRARIQKLLQEKRQANPGQEPLVLVLCKAGIRSAHSVLCLQQSGITAINITGGIHAWNKYIDPSLPLYDIKDIPELQQFSLRQKRMQQQLWLSGVGAAFALCAIGAVAAVRDNSDLLRPVMQAGVPLAAASDWPVIGYAIKEASEPAMSVQQLRKLVNSKDNNYLIVDVRTPNEYKQAHLPGAISLPLLDLEQGKGIQKIKSQLKGRKLIAYCTKGGRSARALLLLQEAGIVGTKVLGGLEAWAQEIDPSLAVHKG